jgi:hypothetical protein
MFAPFSGLPLGGEGEGNRREERAKSLEVLTSRAREFAMPPVIGWVGSSSRGSSLEFLESRRTCKMIGHGIMLCCLQ